MKGDGPVGKLRRWYQQFYSLGSPIIREDIEAARKAEKMCTASCEDGQEAW